MPGLPASSVRRATLNLARAGWLEVGYQSQLVSYEGPKWKAIVASEGSESPPSPSTSRTQLFAYPPLSQPPPAWIGRVPEDFLQSFYFIACGLWSYTLQIARKVVAAGIPEQLADTPISILIDAERHWCHQNSIRWRDALGPSVSIEHGYMRWLPTICTVGPEWSGHSPLPGNNDRH